MAERALGRGIIPRPTGKADIASSRQRREAMRVELEKATMAEVDNSDQRSGTTIEDLSPETIKNFEQELTNFLNLRGFGR